MDLEKLDRISDFEWRIAPVDGMHVPAVIYADESLIRDMDEKVYEQVTNVARLPGIVKASYAMPDAHWGYGFPIGGVAAFDPERGGIISAGGVGFDISCGVRTLLTGLTRGEVEARKAELADALFAKIPAGVGSIHCGSRGLGHQIGTEFLRDMAIAAGREGIYLPDRELACAPINSPVGQRYLGAMRAGINCALANRQIIAHLTREVFAVLFPRARLDLLFDVSHNTCKVERHKLDGESRDLYIHRKGATRAFGPGHPSLPEALRRFGQPVLIGGSMGTGSYVLAGTAVSEARAFSSACHGAGRRMSRHQALKTWRGRQVVDELAARGILIRSRSGRGVAEEAPGAYKDVAAVVDASDAAGLARKVAKVVPLACIKG